MRSHSSIPRPFWLAELERAWAQAPIVWLAGVRRVGKTTLAKSLPDSLYLNCDLPSTARRVEDPERFFAGVDEQLVIFDEIHQLPDPSRLLKIAADEYPHLRILATGSSTLAATQKFSDSLTGRKRTLHLVPVLFQELPAFGVSLERRLLHGGLPEGMLAPRLDEERYAEWLDSYFARDIQELFNIAKRQEFLRLVELVLRQSGGVCEMTSLAKLVGLSRPTVSSYLEALQLTQVIQLLRPFHAGGRQEIVQQPKVFGFDTGFVAYCKQWRELRDDDLGQLWEHLVLETLMSAVGSQPIHYWRDKRQHEVDFVVSGAGRADAIECKWEAARFSPTALFAFREIHPEGRNFVVSPQVEPASTRRHGAMEVTFCRPDELAARLTGER